MPLIWGFLFLVQFWRFNFLWMVTAGVCFSLATTNAQAYYNCRRSHQKKLTDFIRERGMSMFREAATASIVPTSISAYLPAFLGGKKPSNRDHNDGSSGRSGDWSQR